MTTLVAFAPTADGYLSSNNATYATARAGGTLNAVTNVNIIVGQNTGYYCYEGFINFDTSGLGSSAVLDSVSLMLFVSANNTTTDFTLQARLYDWGGTLTTGDWVAGANLSSSTLLATYDTSGTMTGYLTLAESGTNLVDNVSKTGTTSIILDSDRHANGDTPTTIESATFSGADTAGRANDPRLVVQYHIDTTATYYSGAADGYIKSANADYATARAGGTLTVDTTAKTGRIGQQAAYNIYEMFVGFATSDLGATATINAVTLSLCGSTDSSTTDFTIQALLYNWGGTLTDADWVAGANLGANTLLATYSTADGFLVTSIGRAYFTESSTNLVDNISKTGTTFVLLCSDRHAAGNTPTLNEYVDPYTADQDGTTNDPMLVVDYTSAAAGVARQYMYYQRVRRAA